MNEQTKREILYAMLEEMDRQGLVEWEMETVEEPGMRLYKRYTAKIKFPDRISPSRNSVSI